MFPSGNPRAMSRCIARDNIGKILENPRCSTPTPPFFFFVEHCEKSRGETERGGRRGSVEIKGEKREKGGGPLSGAALDGEHNRGAQGAQ